MFSDDLIEYNSINFCPKHDFKAGFCIQYITYKNNCIFNSLDLNRSGKRRK